jgi:hypothetical protein
MDTSEDANKGKKTLGLGLKLLFGLAAIWAVNLATVITTAAASVSLPRADPSKALKHTG